MSELTVLFSGTANPALTEAIARELALPLSVSQVERFPDGEVSVLLGESVRGKSVFIVQPTAPPVDAHLVELLAFIDACRRASAARITAVMPYAGYSRADRRGIRREPIMARVVAEVLQAVGVDHVITIDLHTPQIEGFYHVPVDSLTAVSTLCGALKNTLPADSVVVSPDGGRVPLATEYANRLGIPLIVLHKRRQSGSDTTVTHIVGDVRDRACLIVDDIIATGGTLDESIRALLDAGAKPEVTIAATHGLLIGQARQRLMQPAVREVVVTDTVPVAVDQWPRLRVVSVAGLLATAMRRILGAQSLRDLV